MSKAASLFNSKPIQVKESPAPEAPAEAPAPGTRKAKLRAKKKKQQLTKRAAEPQSEYREKRPYVKPEMSVAQVSEREARTVFVGNTGLKTTKKALLKLFRKFGKITNMWVRSLPLDLKSKIDMKGGAGGKGRAD